MWKRKSEGRPALFLQHEPSKTPNHPVPWMGFIVQCDQVPGNGPSNLVDVNASELNRLHHRKSTLIQNCRCGSVDIDQCRIKFRAQDAIVAVRTQRRLAARCKGFRYEGSNASLLASEDFQTFVIASVGHHRYSNPFVDEVCVEANAECDAGNRSAGLGTLLNDLSHEGLGIGTALWLHEIPI